MDIAIGTEVVTEDGERLGKVDRVVLNPVTGEITDLVIHKGVFVTRDLLAPIAMVRHASRDRIVLSISKHQLDDLPDFVERRYVYVPKEEMPPWPLPEQSGGAGIGLYLYPTGYYPIIAGDNYPLPVVDEEENMPTGTVDVSEGTIVEASDGLVGAVDHVVMDEASGKASGYMIRRSKIRGKDVYIPFSWVEETTPQRMKLNRTKAEVERQPPGPPPEPPATDSEFDYH